MPFETVPRTQKEITLAARARGIPVIIATQVLESMLTEPRPTRAEVSDAANAVDDGVDAIMLAGETAVGAFPVRAVRTLDAIVREAEAMPAPTSRRRQRSASLTLSIPESHGHEEALCEAAAALARLSGADAIIAVTRKGNTARHLSALRSRAPVYAATASADVARRLTLFRGVVPLVVPVEDDVAIAYMNLAHRLRDAGRIPSPATLVFVNVAADLTKTAANFLKLMRLEN
jgi:pyruvate kinase